MTFSAIALIVANLVTVYGVLALGWDFPTILILYWLESAIIGASAIIKMLFAKPDENDPYFTRLIYIPFFVLHYGFFLITHVVVLAGLITYIDPAKDVTATFDVTRIATERLVLAYPAIIGLSLSHLFSMFFNYFGKKEYRVQTVVQVMMSPYSRVIAMHLTLFVGSFIIMFLGPHVVIVLVFVIIKTLVDLLTHLASHGKLVVKS